ncbi:MAG TPA: hypothetical protein DEQ87_05505 [Algoriphagus sp.]|jgi:hypothetical protein|uniref:CopG-like RHH_1 or ribbon-helix-helix domain-containing protein, RHH_5 n=1 Tax=Algoriphagus ornithinivorans TaxID=226506 RepID=A0A1I5ITB4_9BACT|nr:MULTISPECIES: DUF6364 family protein [Algoriphagus]MAL12973.1 hypothetical protein [Algoriphagus sp.]MAN86293.1 hypothetical protein [Algoriphagus sp.]QYH39305.1 hypothetical protein GYM62_11110 [Algoriphagus sp. NBT04N3]SFO63815.1 CopG-like RHH_1 or ribbon-helix-helix domain-containing protein, RHH_5 [Algoriphagus ornithinivorans]HAD50505.1 hypothetical protein [Algoriphagus sp.]|tara:strand:+ start:185 stop:451 length:267 start_codon:yes stop_codon:yes gene_type:complete
MKKRLNITIDAELLDKIKRYADKEEKSISSLVEEHFEKLISRKTGLPEGMSLVEYMQSLPKFDFPENFDYKEEYYKAKAKKLGYEDLF